MKTPHVKLILRSPLRLGFLLIPLVLACFALLPQARAVCQEGCLTNENTVLGDDAFLNNGNISNTAIGSEALLNNIQNWNTAIGAHTLVDNTTGANNTAIGAFALNFNTTGSSNTAIGLGALISNTTGVINTAIGIGALENNTIGRNNIAVGFEAGVNHATGSNNIYIGSRGFPGEDRTIRIGEPAHGRTFIAGINGVTVAGGVGVIVDTNGQLGTVVSSERFKDEVKPMDKASEAILALKPVTFRYKHELDPKGIPQFGVVAEDVEKVNPALVARDAEGKVFTVRYEAVNAMLLNEFLKEHKRVEEQQTNLTRLNSKVANQAAIMAQQQKGMEILTSQLKEQAAQIQKVRAQLQLNRSTATTVASDQ